MKPLRFKVLNFYALRDRQLWAEVVWKRECNPALAWGTAQVGCRAYPVLKMLLAARLSGP